MTETDRRWMLGILGSLATLMVAGCGEEGRDASPIPTTASAEAAKAAGGVLEITVTSTQADEALHVAYMVPDGSSRASEENVALPWTKRWDDVNSLPNSWVMSAALDGTGDITCSAKFDGTVIAEKTATGPSASVVCMHLK